MIRTALVLLLLGFLASGPTLASDHELRGKASWVRASLGSRYLALREPRGTVATVCGAGGCVTRVVTDFGPSKRVHPDRVADLSAADFVKVCGEPLSVGTCPVTVTLDAEPNVPLPQTDTEAQP